MRIKVNIPGFGNRFCSNNVEYKLYAYSYYFYKKGTYISHNEYGPSDEYRSGAYKYKINDKYHRLKGAAFYNGISVKTYDVIGKCVGITKGEFIKNLSNVLIPNDENFI